MKSVRPVPLRAQTQQIALRVPLPLLEQIDAYAEQICSETRMFRVTRTEAALLLIRRGLEAIDKVREPAAEGSLDGAITGRPSGVADDTE